MQRTADAMNRDFVAVKVDREEHPEVDAAYMSAAAAFTPHLGWPLTVFTTPSGRPFYAGTYFPPEPRAGMPSFRQVLTAVEEAWTERREQVDEHRRRGGRGADRGARGRQRRRARGCPTSTIWPPPRTRSPRARTASSAGSAPATSPSEVPDRDRAAVPPVAGRPRARSPAASAVADRALAAMASSELRDPVEGGFFRYATRARLDRPALRADADRQRPAARRRHSTRAMRDAPAGSRGSSSTCCSSRAAGSARPRTPSRGSTAPAARAAITQRDAAARSHPRAAGRRRKGRDGLERPGDRRARARRRTPGRTELDRGGALGGRRGARCQRRARTERWCAHRSTRSPRALRPRSPTTASSRPVSPRSPSATGEAAYAERARDLVVACGGPDGELRTPGGGDPVLAAQGIGTADAASDGDEPSGAAAVAGAATALWLLRCGGGVSGRWPNGSSQSTRARLSRSRSRTAHCCASQPSWRSRRGSSSSSAATRRLRWWRPRGACRADVLAIVTPGTVFAVGGGGFRAVRGERAAERRGDGVRLPRLRLPAARHRRRRARRLSVRSSPSSSCARARSRRARARR